MAFALAVATLTGSTATTIGQITMKSFYISPTSNTDRELLCLLGCEDEFAQISGDVSAIEIDRSKLLDLRIDLTLDMVNGQSFSSISSCIAELARAQEAARVDGAHVLVQDSF